MSTKRILEAQQIVGGVSAPINYILNSSPHKNTSGWVTYDDGTSSSPVNGIDGTVTLTLTRSTSSPLRGDASFLLTTTAANLQGEGASYNFSIDSADQAKVLNISFDYAFDVTQATGDWSVWIYDVTNSQLIQPAGYQVPGGVSGTNYKFQGTFQTASNSTSYRLIIHRSVTTATAVNFKVDNVVVGPEARVFGAPVTDSVAITTTLSNAGNATITMRESRIGDRAFYEGLITIGSSLPTGTILVNLPRTIDTTKLLDSTATVYQFGYGVVRDTGTELFDMSVGYNSSTTVGFFVKNAASTYTKNGAAVNATTPMTFAAGDTIDFKFDIPIQGWSSSVELSSSTDTRVVQFNGSETLTTALSGTPTTISFTSINDSHAAYSAGSYTVPVPGRYQLNANVPVYCSATGTTATGYFYKNGSLLTIGANTTVPNAQTGMLSVSGSEVFNAGDVITFRVSNAGGTAQLSGQVGSMSIQRLSGPATIAASESVNARYTSTAGTSIDRTNDTLIDFATKDYDSHNSVATGASWKFTAPISGKYNIAAMLTFQSAVYSVGDVLRMAIFKGGVLHQYISRTPVQTTTAILANTVGSGDINLLAGEYIDLRILNNRTAGNASLSTTAGECWIAIKRVGN